MSFSLKSRTDVTSQWAKFTKLSPQKHAQRCVICDKGKYGSQQKWLQLFRWNVDCLCWSVILFQIALFYSWEPNWCMPGMIVNKQFLSCANKFFQVNPHYFFLLKQNNLLLVDKVRNSGKSRLESKSKSTFLAKRKFQNKFLKTMMKFLAALAALYLTLVSHCWLTDSPPL